MIKTIYFIFFACAFSLGLWACAGNKKEAYKNLSSSQFEELIKSEKVELVDVRTAEEYMEGHIPGSLNINVKDTVNFPISVDEQLDRSCKIAVYCRSGRRSRTAADILSKKGFKVYNLDKGILNWMEEGREIEK